MEGLYALRFAFWIHLFTAIGTLGIAFAVATITKSQWKTNQEKLRLDLYAKRFEIYMRTLDFHNALLEWKDDPEPEPAQVALIAPFFRAFRESRFLFPESAGVYRFMEEFSQHAFHITNYKKARDGWGEGFPEEKIDLALARTDHVSWILTSIPTLEDRIATFLNFHAL